jgi:valyl-tRNA synthetase
VNLENWPKPSDRLRNKKVEEDFETLFKTASLSYAARQSVKLKRRWPLRKMVVVAPENVCEALKGVEDMFLELANVKSVKYFQKAPVSVSGEGWVSAVDGDLQVFLDGHRDEGLLGEGLMRDLARRVQALRKEQGYMPADVLETVHIAELEEENIRLLRPYLKEMQELVRTRKVQLLGKREESKGEWHECQLDDKKICLMIT